VADLFGDELRRAHRHDLGEAVVWMLEGLARERDRCLELFKIVSKNGTPEVWLLGQRLAVPALP